MLKIMMEQKKPVKNNITLSGERLCKYFPRSYGIPTVASLFSVQNLYAVLIRTLILFYILNYIRRMIKMR